LVRAGEAGTLAARPTLEVLVQHGGAEHVDSVMVDGRWVMREGHILTFDEATMLADAQAQSVMIQQRSAPNLAVLLAAMPGIAARFRGTVANVNGVGAGPSEGWYYSVLRVKTSVAIRVPPMREKSASRSVAS